MSVDYQIQYTHQYSAGLGNKYTKSDLINLENKSRKKTESSVHTPNSTVAMVSLIYTFLQNEVCIW